jgi:hypothetical protein
VFDPGVVVTVNDVVALHVDGDVSGPSAIVRVCAPVPAAAGTFTVIVELPFASAVPPLVIPGQDVVTPPSCEVTCNESPGRKPVTNIVTDVPGPP